MNQLISEVKEQEVVQLREILQEKEKEINELKDFIRGTLNYSSDTEALYQKAIDHFGQINQINQLTEECAELIFAINKWRRGIYSVNQVSEEFADVGLMLEQLSMLFNPEEIQRVRLNKIEKLKESLAAKPD